MSCSDSKKSKKRKSSKSGNMGDVLGKECGDGEKDEMPQETCGEDVREEADGAPSGDEQSSQSSGEPDNFELKRSDEVKDEMIQSDENTVLPVISAAAATPREEKPCTCEACKDRRELAAEQLEEMRRLQSYWMELRQYIRMVYRMAMEGRTVENNDDEDYEAKMKELVQKLCARDPHQLFQRLESQVQEFVIEAKVRQLELVHRGPDTPELAQVFLTGLLEGYDKLCLAAKQLAPLLQQLESEHLQRFNLTWEVLNKHLYQSCVYTDPLVQNNLPHYIGQLRNMLPGKNEAYSQLVHHYLAFDDEMTLIGAMWRDTETLVHEYNQEQATLKAKQRMLREDWELFKAQRKLIQQKMWNKTASELREFDEQLMTLASLGGPTPGPGPGSPRDSSPDDETAGTGGYCPGCSSRRGCPCDECAVTHLLTCGGLITPPDSPGPLYSHKVDVQDYRVEGEGSEQPPESPLEPDIVSDGAVVGGEVEGTELAPVQQQSCECHVCTAPLMTPMDLMESYECHNCVQQGVPIPGGTSAVNLNLNLHAGGFHLYPHIHGTGGGGDAGSLYPHLYNIHPSLLTQLGNKHSRLGVHLQDQLQLSGAETKPSHLLQSQLQSPATAAVSELLPPGMTLEALPPSTSPPNMVTAAATTTAAGFSTPPPNHPKSTSPGTSPSASKTLISVPQPHKQPSPGVVTTATKETIPVSGASLVKLGAPCREHSGSSNLQNSASTQTSPSKAKTHLQQHVGVVQQKSPVGVATSSPHSAPQSALPRQQLAQNPAKRGPAVAASQPSTNGHHHPIVTRSSPNVSSVRHSTTQTGSPAGHPHNHSHQSLPDVVKSAATSTTSHRAAVGSTASKVPAHSCHKSLKNGGSIEPIKRVACTDYPDSEVVDLEDSSSQDDTCSERSSSTTTSTQRDSRHCDCCYCEVFGHGMPSVAPVSRNYQEMRERLRLLLTKKKAKCKIGNTGAVPTSGTGTPAVMQTGNTAPTGGTEAAVKPSTTSAVGPSSTPSPATSGPVLAKQDSAESLPQPLKDPRDLEALLDFIEGTQTTKCKDAKKAAKKARQKQKKLEEKERKDQEEAERQRLEDLQNKTPEVTITVVNTPNSLGVGSNLQTKTSSSSQSNSGKGSKNSKKGDSGSTVQGNDSKTKVGVPGDKVLPQVTQQPPQMVTIKRVMEANGAEPTVTITLKGATPDKDKVLFTLVNGQGDYLCQSQEDSKASANVNMKNNQCNANSSANGKKKKNKGNGTQQQNNPPTASNKPQHSTAKSATKPAGTNSSSGGKQQSNGTVSVNNKVNTSQQQQKLRPSSAVVVNHTANDMLSVISPVSHAPSVNHLTTATAIKINNVINTISSAGKAASVSSAMAQTPMPATGSRSFSLENLKLPPGITITKVDGPTAAALRKSQSKPPENSRPPSSNHSSTTIISAPTSAGSSNRLGGYGGGNTGISQGIGGSNVIVVDTGKMKEELETVTMNGDDSNHNNGGNSKKKNKKKNKNQNTGNGNINGNINQMQRQQVGNGIAANQVNGKSQNNSGGKNQGVQNGSNIRVQPQVHPLLTKHNIRPQTLTVNASQLAQQPAIIKVNGSMVTIRNPALQQAMATGSRFSQHGGGRAEILVNGEVPTNKQGNKPGKKPVNSPTANGIVGVKGKENSTVPPRFANADNVMLRNRLAPQVEYNGLNSIPGLHISKVSSPVGRGEENGIRGPVNMLPPRMRIQQQSLPSHMTDVRKMTHNHVNATQEGSPAARSVMQAQAQSAMREAMAASMAAANEAKKKKKKKKGAGGQGHADDWNLVESVFAPKDIDLENGDIDDDERELEAFKRFCFNSVPPKRKEKVHLNIKDIVLKKKSSAIGCS
ncbi:uncharacterized protein [Periplaneta americana]|uniref:uncharacterized protein isoform X3 n=1 Tax=Periplaneta americana TaxID=6978 RepID=UPI0037E79272